ncbi:MAG TPA: galactokinase [Anaerolineales bacterium]|nr:galactokinase [Anaerolineales bacterium]
MTMLNFKDKTRQAFRQQFGKDPEFLAAAPGRVNILGEHVDYNDGFVLPAAIDRAAYIAFSPSKSGIHTIFANDFDQNSQFNNNSIINKVDLAKKPLSDWALYPAGVAWALLDEGLEVAGMDAVFCSDIPRGAGLSSSAAVEMAFAIAWQTLGQWEITPMQRALIGQKAENRYVGVNCGIMDQFSSACGVADRLLLLDCRSLNWRTIALPKDFSIVVADTSIRRKLTEGEYNQRKQSCDQAVTILAKQIPGIKSLRDVSLKNFERYSNLLPDPVNKRARHVVEEIDRTLRAIPLLENGDIEAFGKLMVQAHLSLRNQYQVSIPQLDLLVEIAMNQPGCVGSRLTGAGFGGCTVNLVKSKFSEDFTHMVKQEYKARTGLNAALYITRPSYGARLITI